MTRTIYLSGPMTGLPEFNYPAFREAAARLRGLGHRVYNPAEFAFDGPLDQFPIRSAFEEYTRFICREACTIVMLPGWESSAGACVEHALASRIGLDVLDIGEITP